MPVWNMEHLKSKCRRSWASKHYFMIPSYRYKIDATLMSQLTHQPSKDHAGLYLKKVFFYQQFIKVESNNSSSGSDVSLWHWGDHYDCLFLKTRIKLTSYSSKLFKIFKKYTGKCFRIAKSLPNYCTK